MENQGTNGEHDSTNKESQQRKKIILKEQKGNSGVEK